MTNTPNHNYNTPGEGTTNWHIPLNENFDNLDTDVEVRGLDSEKAEYEPKKGAKYEATDSGGIYLGDGDSWILADRNVNTIESNSGRFGRLWDSKDNGIAIVAPSISSAFDTIQGAINSGYLHIQLAEDITEGNITVPSTRIPFRLEGIGDGRPVINDPQNGNPVITVEDSVDTGDCLIQDFGIAGGVDSGPAFDLSSGPNNAAVNWQMKNIESNAGPWLLGGFRHTLYHCKVENVSEVPITKKKKDIYPSIVTSGATCGFYGGKYSTLTGTDNAVIGSAAYSVTGGVTFHNKSDDSNKAGVTFDSSARGFISGFSVEGADETFDIRFGLTPDASAGLEDSVIAAPSIGGGTSEATWDVNATTQNNIFLGINTNLRVEQDSKGARFNNLLFTRYGVELNGPNSQDLTVIRWNLEGGLEIGNVNAGATPLNLDVASSEPKDNSLIPASLIVADGDGWDPDGDGKAELVIRNAANDDWIEIADLGSKL